MIAFFISIAAFCSTMIGGSLALKLRDRLHLILGFSAGAVVAVAFFDLMPEALQLGQNYGIANMLAFVAGGFLLYLLLDRLILLHAHHDHDDGQKVESRGHVRAGSLSIHSFLDGVGIGLAFQVNAGVGAVVAAAVLA